MAATGRSCTTTPTTGTVAMASPFLGSRPSLPPCSMHRTRPCTISFTFLCGGLAQSQDLAVLLWDMRYSVIFTSCGFLFLFGFTSHRFPIPTESYESHGVEPIPSSNQVLLFLSSDFKVSRQSLRYPNDRARNFYGRPHDDHDCYRDNDLNDDYSYDDNHATAMTTVTATKEVAATTR
ncbi:hypothetical protein H4582DRAFT_1253892 [Lactarius indigo]|nr:hypothetical protein H4582DRAFT_1253892 [Lactarius indigo]